MITHYNAFISYRHEKRDIAVAKEVQTQLEHFRIPEELKETGRIDRIERIFRDKDELPLTSNLSDDIETALRMSDYLIVICSEHTAESQWVQREIDLFLETHSQECVLTVLSGGEPEDVIPERLTYRIEKEVDKDGNVRETRIPLEPLSCDYRMPFRTARKKELPRLAAVMIGCAYDELVQRSEQYRTRRRRLITGAAGAAGITAISYLLWSNARINENLELALENLRQSQIHESQYLSAESLEALNDQDRILAVQLALAALPDGETERPVIAEAEYALASAIGTYQMPEHLTDYFAVRKYSTEAVIRDFMISPDYSVLALFDNDRRLTLIRLDNNETISETQLDTGVNVTDAKDQGIACITGNTVTMRSWQDGSTVYRTELSHWISVSDCSTDACVFAGDGAVTILNGRGDILHTAACPESALINSARISAYGDEALIQLLEDDVSTILLYDGEEDTLRQVGQTFSGIMDMAVAGDGSAVILEMLNDYNHATYGFENAVFYYDMTARLACYSAESAAPRWSADISFTQSSGGSLAFTPYSDETGVHNGILCSTANIQTLVDAASGRVIRRAEYPVAVSSLLNARDNVWLSLLHNGNVAMFELDSESVTTFDTFPDNTSKGIRFFSGDTVGVMILPQGGRSVIRYEMDFANPNYSELPGIFPGYSASTAVYDRFLLVSDRELSADTAEITAYDLDAKQPAYTMSVETGQRIACFGMTSDLSTIYAVTPDTAVHMLDPADGSQRTHRIAEDTGILSAALAAEDDTVFALINDLQGNVWYGSYDLAEDTEELHAVDAENAGIFDTLTFRSDHRYCVSETYLNGLKCLYLFDLSAYTAVPVCTSEITSSFMASCGDSFLALRDTDCIRLFDYSGAELNALPMDMMNVLSFRILEDRLYVLYNSSLLEVYDRTGEKITGYSVFFEENTSFNSYDVYDWHLSDNTLLFGNSTVWNVLDLSQNQSKCYITNVLAYDPGRSQIIVRRWSPESIGAFRLCTTEELIAAGRELTGGEELSNETKQLYGLK